MPFFEGCCGRLLRGSCCEMFINCLRTSLSEMASSRRARRASQLKERSARRRKRLQRLEKAEEAAPAKVEVKGLLRVIHDYYKPLLLIPFLLLVFALVVLGVNKVQTGEFITKGVSLKGGITLTVYTNDASMEAVSRALRDSFPSADIDVRGLSELGRPVGVIINAADVDEEALVAKVESLLGVSREEIAVETIDASLGASFFRQTVFAMLLSFVFMGVVVFLYFRTFVPSVAVILAAFSDIVITMAVIDVLGVRLTTAGIAAFLMLIGYSVDTDILLSVRVLKRKQGSVFDRVVSAMRTGLTMSLTTIVAVTVALLVTRSEVIAQIMLILLIGLLVDLVMTWLQNAGILRWYLALRGEEA
ncbi:protein translocase subunit SecF [Candidatus Woesearchaeota archaeon]|nr:MAG: protein translocase subunit SecF [Candidatus Woesearchaeota archaeon]